MGFFDDLDKLLDPFNPVNIKIFEDITKDKDSDDPDDFDKKKNMTTFDKFEMKSRK